MTVRRLGGVVSVMASRGINLGCEAMSDRLDRSAFKRLRRFLVTPLAAGGSLALYGLSRLMDGVAARRDRLGGDVPARRELSCTRE